MTEDRLPLAELLQKAGEGDFLRAVAEAVLQLLMESDVEGVIGAGRYERSPERSNYRNGFRERALDTRLGTLQLRVPKLRQGSRFPPCRTRHPPAAARPARAPGPRPRRAASSQTRSTLMSRFNSWRHGCSSPIRSEAGPPPNDRAWQGAAAATT